MFYIKRNADGDIVTLSKEATSESSEQVSADDPQVLAFLANEPGAKANFLASDLAFVRVVEDLMEVLLDKGVISFTDLPQAAQNKVMQRKSLRAKNNINLIGEDGGII
ncbi:MULTISPECIES: tryptophan synthase subunit beta like protein [unclassified Halomonas]|uniref:tryptophan synthase subunit beta like protein n=1 Tax=unclassified Halomonas TaxID=2609666 RepID=UPI002076B12D|nr:MULTISPECIES: tryptophan synthase subunit beta like protein [unclassified Halomonas]